MTPSPWSDHVKIAIRCWSRDRARQFAERAIKTPEREMETFLAELLADALMTFNESYNSAYNEHIQQLERLLEETQSRTLMPPILTTSKPDRG